MDYRLPALNYGSESCHQIISARFKYQEEEQSSVHHSSTLTFSTRQNGTVTNNLAQKSIVIVIQNLYNKNTSVCMLNQLKKDRGHCNLSGKTDLCCFHLLPSPPLPLPPRPPYLPGPSQPGLCCSGRHRGEGKKEEEVKFSQNSQTVCKETNRLPNPFRHVCGQTASQQPKYILFFGSSKQIW